MSRADLAQEDSALLIAPALAASLQGRDIEEVSLLRDEAANLAWAVERATEGEDGLPADQAQAAHESVPPVAPSPRPPDTLPYRLRTDPPPDWFPLIPQRAQTTDPSMTFRLGALPRVTPGGPATPLRPRGRLLAPMVRDPRITLRDDEIPRERRPRHTRLPTRPLDRRQYVSLAWQTQGDRPRRRLQRPAVRHHPNRRHDDPDADTSHAMTHTTTQSTPTAGGHTMPSINQGIRPRSGTSRRLSRRPVSLAAAFLLALTAVIVPASTATATSVDALCGGAFARNFSPAVSLTPRMITVTEASNYNTCLLGPTATGMETLTLTLGCIPAMAGPAVIETVSWNDATGATSTISWSAPTIVAQTVVFTGTVTAGRHVGDRATKVTSGVSYVGSVVKCLLGTPIASTTGLVDGLLLTH
jgi:hypothetical protein